VAVVGPALATTHVSQQILHDLTFAAEITFPLPLPLAV
jgi:hypothetical protein